MPRSSSPSRWRRSSRASTASSMSYSQTEDDGVLVTARFEVGTSSDAAVLRVHARSRQSRPHPRRHSRACRSSAAASTMSRSPSSASRRSRRRRQLVGRRRAGRASPANCRSSSPKLPISASPRSPASSPSSSASSPTARSCRSTDHAGAASGQDRRRRPLVRRRPRPRRRRAAHARRRADLLQQLADIGNLVLTARDGRPGPSCAMSPISCWLRARTRTSVTGSPAIADGLVRRRCRLLALAKRPGSMRSSSPTRSPERLEAVRGGIVPEDLTLMITATTARAPTRGERAAVPSRTGDDLVSSSWSPSRSAGARRRWCASVIPTTILLSPLRRPADGLHA